MVYRMIAFDAASYSFDPAIVGLLPREVCQQSD
jgi:hypothetical protein